MCNKMTRRKCLCQVALTTAVGPFARVGNYLWAAAEPQTPPSAGPVGADALAPVQYWVFCKSPQSLRLARTRVMANRAAYEPALAKLGQEANAARTAGPFSVFDNNATSDNGDRHDYLSFGPYWWPDPAKKDGLPYIRRDGEVNPLVRDVSQGCDRPLMNGMADAVQTLAMAYYFQGNEACAARAGTLLRAWFLDAATKMNPNLEHGQAIRGRCEGRPTGIIETYALIRVVYAARMLEGSQAWSKSDRDGLVDWFAAYLSWLLTSPFGKEERAVWQNHGTWCDAQIACFAIYAGQEAIAREAVARCRERIARQIGPDGRQLPELDRVRSFFYSIFGLQGMFALAGMGEELGMDLWHFETPDGRSLRKSLGFLSPYADPKKAWPFPELSPTPTLLLSVLEQGVSVYGEEFEEALRKLPAKTTAESYGRLVFDCVPSQNVTPAAAVGM